MIWPPLACLGRIIFHHNFMRRLHDLPESSSPRNKGLLEDSSPPRLGRRIGLGDLDFASKEGFLVTNLICGLVVEGSI
ncbi:hypothetical protein GUJ93_ZPchr0001g30163 [Zizania palustris]|uniref:Uncharacterized protein n=1 Tax=Zizania palustris TaxID=103762 RepID=A0A8J5RPT4_ZIZPA|nr:hypothetical protein GUJ93_ZPchr0001g30163 [Zizania palustris]